MTDADASFLVESMSANTLVHEALHCLLMGATMELVALLIFVTALTVRDSPLAQHVYLVFLVGAILGIHRERIVLLVANAFPFAAQRSDAQLGDALVRIATLLFVVNHRQTGGVLCVRYKTSRADALLFVAYGVGRLVRAVLVLLTELLCRCDYGMALLLIDDEVVGAGTIQVRVIAMREVIVNNALFIDLAGFSQFNGFAHAPLGLPARNKSLFANT